MHLATKLNRQLESTLRSQGIELPWFESVRRAGREKIVAYRIRRNAEKAVAERAARIATSPPKTNMEPAQKGRPSLLQQEDKCKTTSKQMF